jgi:hypothetical protein
VYNSVAIHYLISNTVMDIRHQIYVHPVIAVSNLDGNAPTQTAMLGCVHQNATRQCPLENGYGWGSIFGTGSPGCTAFNPNDHAGLDWNIHYKTYDCSSQVSALTYTTCLTTFSEPHWEWVASTGPSYITAMKKFISSGANFFAQCASTESYENQAGVQGTGTFLSNYGLSPVNPSDGIDPPTTVTEFPDLPVLQMIGQMSSDITGAVPDFYNLFSATDTPPAGWNPSNSNGPQLSAYNNFYTGAGGINSSQVGFPLVTDVYNSYSSYNGRNIYVAAGGKYNLNNQLGSNIWYLTGHTWVGQTNTGDENGRRFFMNAMLVPALRPKACGFSFCSPGDVCTPQDACHTCTCAADGSGFVQTVIPNCCTSSFQCDTANCQVCDLNSHQCVLTPGCCTITGTVNCSACQTCVNGACSATSGCCTVNSQCGNTPCKQCISSQCVDVAGCCDPTSGINPCTGTCMTCDTINHNCTRQNYSACCLANTDCGSSKNPCLACNPSTHQCYSIPGCCNVNSDCGTDPCIQCVGNACVSKSGCCTIDAQCGACQVCSNQTNTCGPSPDKNCCINDTQCGTCRRCAAQGNSKTCVEISQCCLTGADCETCENCTNSQCTTISACCRFDTDCKGCDICVDFNCITHQSLDCCESDNDCFNTAEAQGNGTGCDWVCQKKNNAQTGACQEVCSSGRNWLGLIIGLAAGVPLAILFLLALAALLAFLIYRYRDWLNNYLFASNAPIDQIANTAPTYSSPVTVMNSPIAN